jgi:hypothetical protein
MFGCFDPSSMSRFRAARSQPPQANSRFRCPCEDHTFSGLRCLVQRGIIIPVPPKPSCDCGKCLKCCYRTIKRASRLKQRTPLKRPSKPIARKTAVKKKRAKPRRVAVLRDAAYRAWIRERRCIACAACGPKTMWHSTIDPAHTKNNGRGSKGADSDCIPLCRYHHQDQHRVGWPAFESEYGIDRHREAEAHYLAYTIWRESQQP